MTGLQQNCGWKVRVEMSCNRPFKKIETVVSNMPLQFFLLQSLNAMSFWRVQVLMITSFTGCNTDANELNIFFSLSLILINISFPQYPIKNFFDEVRLLKREEVKVRQFLRTICQISNINTKRFEIPTYKKSYQYF